MEQLPEEAPDASAQTTPASESSGEKSTASPPVWIGRDGWLAIATGVADLLFWPIVRSIPSGAMAVVALTTSISLFLVLLFTVRLARAMGSPRAIALNLALALACILPLKLIPFLVHLFPAWPFWGWLRPYWLFYLRPFRAISGLDNLGLIWIAAGLGVALSRLVREFKMLLPMGVALALVDLYTVLGGGVVSAATSGKNTVAQAAMTALTVQLPTVQPKSGAAPISLQIGFADFLFTALFFACFVRFEVPARRIFQVLFGTLFLYMAIVFFTGAPLPALVPIAIVVLGMTRRRFQYERSEAFALLYVGLILVAVLGFLVFRARHG